MDLKQNKAHSARIDDYFLGGKDNYEADQAARRADRAGDSQCFGVLASG